MKNAITLAALLVSLTSLTGCNDKLSQEPTQTPQTATSSYYVERGDNSSQAVEESTQESTQELNDYGFPLLIEADVAYMTFWDSLGRESSLIMNLNEYNEVEGNYVARNGKGVFDEFYITLDSTAPMTTIVDKRGDFKAGLNCWIESDTQEMACELRTIEGEVMTAYIEYMAW